MLLYLTSAAWCSGTILASGARGPGLNSRSSPLAPIATRCDTQMTPAGLEPAIPGSVGRCLIHWATGPVRISPASALQSFLPQRDGREHGEPQREPKWTHWDLNPGPSACEADVIPLHHVPDAKMNLQTSWPCSSLVAQRCAIDVRK